MKTQFQFRFLLAAMLLSLSTGMLPMTAQGEPWNSWRPGAKAKEDFESQLSMARLSERHGQAENAKKIYTAILTKNPQHQMAHHRLAIMFAMEGNFAKADEHFNRAIQTAPASAELMGDQGYSLFLQERFDEAEKSLRQTIQRFPTHKAAHNTLGMVLGKMGRYDEALAEFRLVVGEAEAHANLAFILSQSGQLEQASKHYHQALELDESLHQAAEALIQINQYLPAESAVFTRNPADSSKRTQSASTVGSAHKQVAAKKSAGEGQMAIADATQLKSDDPNNPIPQVAKPAIPQSPQIPPQVQTPFKFAGSAFQAPEATQPQSQQINSVALADKDLIVSVEDEPAPRAEMISPAQLSGLKPAYPMILEPAAPATQTRPKIIDSPYPQVVASDEEEEEPDHLAAARAQADLLMEASPLDQPQAYATYSSADPISTSMDQTGEEYLPTAFIAAPDNHATTQPVKKQVSEVQLQPVSEVNSAAGSSTWKIVLLCVSGIFGLVSVGGAFWYLGKRGGIKSAQSGLYQVEERAFNMEETYTNLENQIRGVWAGRSHQDHTHLGRDTASSYYR